MLNLIRLPVIDFGHPPHPPASESGILIAVPPAVHRPLDETALATQARVELGQCPSNCIALALIVQAVALVLILGATSSRVHAVLRLEFRGETVDIDRLNIATNGVLHLDTVSGVLECDPLNSVLVLSYNKRRSRGNRTRSRIGIDTCTSRWALMHSVGASWRAGGGLIRRAHTSALSLNLGLLHFRAWAPSECGSDWVRGVLG